MTGPEFDAIAALIRSREPVRSAARMVLVDGAKPSDAARSAGLTPQQVGQAVQRIRSADTKVRAAYLTHDEINERTARALLNAARQG